MRRTSHSIIKSTTNEMITPSSSLVLTFHMTTELGSVAPGLRRSARQNLGLNGRDVQLDKLGQVLTAPSHQAQKRFAPTDGLYLPDNALAPVQKKARRGKKVNLNSVSYFYYTDATSSQVYHHLPHRSHVTNYSQLLTPALDSLLRIHHPLLHLLFLLARL